MSNERNRERAGQPERGGLPELVRLATPLDPALGDAEIPDCGPDVARILVRALSMQLRRVERTKILQQLLVEIAEVTGSAFGFVGAVRVNPDNRRELVLLARQGFSIDAHAVSFYGYLEGERLVITNETSLFGSALSRGTVVLRNAPPQAKQVPQASHPIPRTFMALPLYAGDSFVGVVALCNRPQGYDESLVVSIRPAAHVVGLLLSTFRSEDERERLRAELQHGHTRLMSLLAGLPIGMVVHNETRELISANHHFFALFPAIREPPSGRGSFNALALIAGVGRYVGDRLGFKEEVHRFLSQNASVVGVELLLTDGRTILLDFLPIRDANGQLGAVWQFRDVTGDRRFASELMEAKRRAEQSSQTKSRFLATMSHEIRTPLNAILGMADLLLETSLSTEQRNLLRTQRSASETLLNVIQGNLDMAKIEAGRMELDRIPFSLREVVERIIEIHTIRADQKGLELLADIDPRLPPQVLGDPVRTQQIVTNLVSNALKFTDSGGVRVTIRPVDDARPELLEIVVSDSGVGIPEAEQARIFEEFVQAGHRRRADAPGTGLGLPITARLLELMGGSIHCESEVGVGSRFYVRIPFEVVELGPPQRAESSSVFEALILAPTPEARLALSKQMQALGVKSRLALDLADALRGLASRPPSRRQLVLFDVGMLQLSGFRLADLLRACEARILTKVVAITDDDSVISDVLVDPRIHARLNKPIRLEALRQTISGLDEPTALAGGSGLWSMGVAGHDQQPDNTGLRILVVEDHHDNRMLFRTFLVGAGYTVDEVNDGREALRAAIAFRYDLIVMDLQMPNMNGLVATRYIRERERIEGRDPTPIVAVTARDRGARGALRRGGNRRFRDQADLEARLPRPRRSPRRSTPVRPDCRRQPREYAAGRASFGQDRPVPHQHSVHWSTRPRIGLAATCRPGVARPRAARHQWILRRSGGCEALQPTTEGGRPHGTYRRGYAHTLPQRGLCACPAQAVARRTTGRERRGRAASAATGRHAAGVGELSAGNAGRALANRGVDDSRPGGDARRQPGAVR